MIRIVLWDIDGTLLDFEAAEEHAIRALFKKYNMGECSDERLEDYKAINRRYWEALERGEISKPRVLEGRFEEFFGKYGYPVEVAPAFNADYQVALGDTVVFRPNALETVKKLKEMGIPQYAVTNGTKTAQDRKLINSGLDKYFDEVFISDVVGFEKPSVQFFAPVFEAAGKVFESIRPEEMLIVGDSLTSDMRGGENTGIKNCWYRAEGTVNNKNVKLDYEISDLAEVLNII